MMIFDPDPPLLRWAAVRGSEIHEGAEPFDPGLISHKGELPGAGGAAIVLHNGGELLRRSVSSISVSDLDKWRQCAPLAPEHNGMSLKIARHCLDSAPQTEFLFLCETAFFVDLPPETSAYALPYALRQQGIRRFGGNGLLHQVVAERISRNCREPGLRLVSVHLGNRPDVVSIKSGRALETTWGFSPVEGIVSAASTGDIDPTIVFQLLADGQSFEDIHRILSRDSGLSALAGRRVHVADIVRDDPDKDFEFARKLLKYQLAKQIGAAMAVLGGADAIAFSCQILENALTFIAETVENLSFLGLTLSDAPEARDGIWELSAEGAAVRVFGFPYGRWQVLEECAQTFRPKEESR